MISKKIILAISMVLMLTVSPSVFADPVNQSLDTNSTLSYEQKQQFEMESNIEKLDSQIEQLMVEIDKNDKELTNKETEMDLQREKVEALNKDLEKQKDILNDRIRAMYTAGETRYLEVILNSKDISDMFQRVDAVNRIMNYDNNIMLKMKANKEKAEIEQKKTINDNKILQILKQQNEDKLKEMQERKKKIETMIEQIKAKQEAEAARASQETALSNTGNSSEAIKSMINAINTRKANVSYNGINSTNVTGNDLVNFASNFLGVPYLWGGTTPSGFDCSGLVQYAYKNFGIDIPRTTYEQVKVGQTVSKDQLQPGDLVFFGGSDIHHVGMYVGNGLFLHAPRTGDVVKISALSERSDFTIAKRYI